MTDLISPQCEARLVTSEEFSKHASATTKIIVSTAGELKTALGSLRRIMQVRAERKFYGPIRHNSTA